MDVGQLWVKLDLNSQKFEKGMDNALNKMKTHGAKMEALGKKLTLGLTTTIVGGAVAAGKSAMEIQASQGIIQASMGLTEEKAKELNDVVKDIWSSGLGKSIAEVRDEVLNTAKYMDYLNNTDLNKLSRGVETISYLFEEDSKAVAAAAGVMQKNFGIGGTKALDLITVGFQRGGDYSGELLDTLREYAPQFKDLGLSAEQSLGALLAGAEAGAWNLDKVGDSMKEFSIRAIDGSKGTAEGFAAIGLNADEMAQKFVQGGEEAQNVFAMTVAGLAAMDDKVAQDIAGVQLFGTQWEDVRSQVVFAMAEGMKGVENFEGANAKATKDIQKNNPGLELTNAMRRLVTASTPILVPFINLLSDTVVPAIKGIGDGFSALPSGVQKAVAGVIAGLALLGPAMTIAGKTMQKLDKLKSVAKWLKEFKTHVGPAVTATKKIIQLFGKFSGAIKGLNILSKVPALISGVRIALGLLTGPVGLIIAVVGTLAVVVWKNWDKIKAWTKTFTDGLKGYFNQIREGVNNLISSFSKLTGLKAPTPDKFTTAPSTQYSGRAGNEDYFRRSSIRGAMAEGGITKASGFYLVGEKGPEIVNIPKGTNVTPNNKLGDTVQHTHDGVVIHRFVNAKDEVIVQVAEEYQRDSRRMTTRTKLIPISV